MKETNFHCSSRRKKFSPNPADLNSRLISSWEISCCDNDKASNSFSFFCFIVSRASARIDFFFWSFYSIESSSAAVQSIIMHLNAVCIKISRNYQRNRDLHASKCIFNGQRIETMKYFSSSAAQFKYRSAKCKFGFRRARFICVEDNQQLSWRFSFYSSFFNWKFAPRD